MINDLSLGLSNDFTSNVGIDKDFTSNVGVDRDMTSDLSSDLSIDIGVPLDFALNKDESNEEGLGNVGLSDEIPSLCLLGKKGQA